MKKTFKNLLALFVTGTMLAGVGCKDYDDDINNLKQEVEDLKGQIELKADASALKSLQEKIDGIDFASFVTKTELSQELAKYVTDTELADALADYVTTSGLDAKIIELGYLKQSEIQSLIDDKFSSITNWTKEDIEAIFDAQIEALNIWGTVDTKIADAIQDALVGYVTGEDLTGALEGYEISQANINAVISAVVGMINAETSDVHSALMNLLGQEFAKELVNYVTVDQLAGYVKTDEIGNIIEGYNYVTYQEVEDEIIEKLGDKGEALTQKIQGLIDASISDSAANVTKENITWLETNDLQTVFDAYNQKIADLWNAVGNLASRIQSLVYVPTTQDGVAAFTSVTLGDAKLTEGQKATMTFRVSPASLATAIAKGYNDKTGVELTFLPEKVTRAEVEPAFTIEGEVTGTTDGKITMLVNSTYEYPEDKSYTYSIALQVKEKKEVTKPAAGEGEEDTTIDTGIEFTSAYVPTKLVPENVLTKVVLVKEVDGKYVEYNSGTGAEYTLEYDQTGSDYEHTLMGDYTFVYKADEKTYMTFKEAADAYNWDVVPSATPAITRSSFNTNEATELSLTPAEPMKDAEAKATMVTVGLKKAVVDNINKSIEDQGTLAVTVGKEKITYDGGYKATLKITRKNLGTIEGLNTTINWVYANQAKTNDYTKQYGGYSASANTYVSGAMIVDGSKYSFLTNERYEQLKTALTTATWTATGDVKGLTVTAFADSDPYVGTDAKAIRYTVENYKNGKGNVEVSTEIEIDKDAMITLKGVIAFKGLEPEVSYDITQEAAIFELENGNLKIKVADDVNDIYEAVYEANFKGQTFFEDADEFKAFMADAAKDNNFESVDVYVEDSKFAGIRYEANKTPQVWAFFKQNMIDFEKNASYTYNVPVNDKTAGTVAPALTIADVFAINFTGAITVNKNDNYYLGVGANLYNGEGFTPYMVARGKIDTSNGTTFLVANVDLTSGYYPVVPDDSKAIVATTYTVQDAPEGYSGDMPKITGSTFNWNACQLDKVTVTATMTVDGLTVDVKTFEVILENPININKWGEFVVKEEKVTTNTKSVVNLFVVMNTPVGETAEKEPVYAAVDIFGNNLMTDASLKTDLAGAYGLKATFGTPKYSSTNNAETYKNFTFDDTKGEITYSANNAPLAGVVTVEVPVTFTYTYAIELVGEAYAPVEYTKTVTVKFSNK